MPTPLQSRSCILNFHGVGIPGGDLPAAEIPYWLSRDSFLRVLDAIVGRSDVQLTFDDGNRSDVDLVLPELQARGLKATFFPCAGRLEDPRYVCDSALLQLADAGMSIGTHGWSHVSWRRLDPGLREKEWSLSTKRLAEAIRRPIVLAACPFGEYDRATVRGLRQCGVHRIFTSDRAWASPHQQIQPRFTLLESGLSDGAGSPLEVPGPFRRVLDRVRILLKSRR